MNERDYDKQKITAYLLGGLPEDEAGLFDELGFTDEHFADALKSAESDLIDSYLQGELAGATLEKFENYYLASPRRHEKVEFARALRTFAEKEIGASAIVAENVSFWDFLKNPARVLQIGFAAAALLIAAFGIFWLANSRSEKPTIETAQKNTPPETAALPDKTDEQNNINAVVENPPAAAVNKQVKPTPKPEKSVNENTKPAPEKEKPKAAPPKPSVAFFALAAPLRGSNKIPTFNVPKNAAKIAVELELEADEYDFYHVKLAGETGKTNLRLNGSYKARNKGKSKVLNINFPAELLNDGIYLLTVSGVNENGEPEVIATYPFRCVIK